MPLCHIANNDTSLKGSATCPNGMQSACTSYEMTLIQMRQLVRFEHCR